MKKKSSSQSAFFNFRVLFFLCAVVAVLVFAAFGQRSAQDQKGSPAQAPDQAQTETQTAVREPLTAADKRALRASDVFANKLYEPLATQVFNLATSRAAAAAEARNSQNDQNFQGPEAPAEGPTLTTDREDYPPFSYVYFHGTGFQPGE